MKLSAAMQKLIKSVRFDDSGLVPAIVQDDQDGTILMFAFMNKESLRMTLEMKKVVFWSRSRKKLWLKGESSGNVQMLKKIYVDCDQDCLLVKVKQLGNAACHTGMRSCFYREIRPSGALSVIGKRIFDPKKVYAA